VGLDLLARLFVLERKGDSNPITDDMEMNLRSSSDPQINLLATMDRPSTPTLGRIESKSIIPSQPGSPTSAISREPLVKTSPDHANNVPLWRILLDMAKSRRGVSGFAMTAIFGLTLGMQDPT
jgi:hypothetical protein